MTENKFDLLTAQMDEEAKKVEAAITLQRRFAEVTQEEGLGFDEAYAAVYHLYYLMERISRESPKRD